MGNFLVGTELGNYEFDASAKTITFKNISAIAIAQIASIANVKDGVNEVIYCPTDPSLGGSITGLVLTLVKDTTLMADTDPLQILIRSNDPKMITIARKDKDLYENQKVAQPFTVFDVTFENHKQVDLWEHILTGGATEGYIADKGVRTLTVGTASGDKAVLVQHGYNQFIEGKEFEINLAHNLGPQKTGVASRGGYFDEYNGFYFEQTATDYNIVHRTNVTGTPVSTPEGRASWNIDKLDGNGPSGLLLGTDIDLSNFGRFEIITQGTVGKTQFAIDIGGELIKLHEFNFDWTQSTAYIERASLPVRWELENVAASASSTTIELQACSVKIFGEYDVTGFPFSISTGITSRTITARTAIIGLRIKTVFGPGAKAPRGVVQLSNVNIAVSGGDVLWHVVLQKGHLGEANIGGPPTWTGINRSTVDYTLDGTTVPTVTPTAGGINLLSGYAIAAQGNNPGDRVQLTGNIVHNITLNDAAIQSDYAILVAEPTGNSATIEGAAMVWSEFK